MEEGPLHQAEPSRVQAVAAARGPASAGEHPAAAQRSGPTSATPTYRQAFAIFEGGGAKGITHIGALKALEQSGYAIVGAAGASAGAIVAALVAVGYKADELFGPTEDILSRNGIGPLDLLGRWRWRWFRLLTRVSGKGLIALPWLLLTSLVVAYLGAPVWVAMTVVFVAILLAVPSALLAVPVMRSGGFMSTTAMRDALNELLKMRLAQHYARLGIRDQLPERVRFKDIDPSVVDGCCRLKIIVSDSRGHRLVQFDQSTGDAVVADAVAASAAIPLVFRPPVIDGARGDGDPVFVDGGLVSNLPVWAFSSEKLSFERELDTGPIPTFAFTLAGGKPEVAAKQARGKRFGAARRGRPPLLEHLRDVLETGIFGSQGIVQEFIPDLTVVELRSTLSTLAFEASREQAASAFEAGRVQAGAVLDRERRIAELRSRTLERILYELRRELPTRRGLDPASAPRLRLSLLEPNRSGALRVIASAGMEGDADDRLELDPRNEAGPRALLERRPTFIELGPDRTALWMTRYERALVPASVRSVISVPIFAIARPPSGGRRADIAAQRVLSLDSDDNLLSEFHDAMFMGALEGLGSLLSATILGENEHGSQAVLQ